MMHLLAVALAPSLIVAVIFIAAYVATITSDHIRRTSKERVEQDD